MARLSLEQASERLDNQSSFGYINKFFLTDDKEHTIVRMLLKDVADIEVYSVHDVKMTSKAGKEYIISVSCHGDNCPLCKEAMKYDKQMFPLVSKAKDNIYIPLIRLYNKDGKLDPVYQVFVRSTRFYRDTLAGFAARYDIDGFTEIERTGAKGSKKTNYSLYSVNKDFNGKPFENVKTIEELKSDFEVKDDDIFGREDSLIKNWTADEFEEFLDTGTYPSRNTDEASQEEEVKPRNRSANRGF